MNRRDFLLGLLGAAVGASALPKVLEATKKLPEVWGRVDIYPRYTLTQESIMASMSRPEREDVLYVSPKTFAALQKEFYSAVTRHNYI